MNNQKINLFIQRLGQYEPSVNVDNFYHKSADFYFPKRKNLRLYLNKMIAVKPKIILVGEAPGYRGCKLTGVPFSSERLLMEERLPFGESIGYQTITRTGKLFSESSATILWDTVRKHQLTPLCWNAFPFHPHHPNKPNSNRKPNKEDLLAGRYFLKKMIQIYQPTYIVAVGQSAAKALNLLGIEHYPVRHPSYGGKKDFEAGIRQLIK